MPRRTTRLVLALLPLIAACQPAGRPDDTVTQGLAGGATRPGVPSADDAALAAFLSSVYGSGARLDRDWTGVPTDGGFRAQGGETDDGTVTRTVCAREELQISGRRDLLLAVCGIPRQFGHPTPGVTDLFLLRDAGGRWVAQARGHFEKFGSMGSTGTVQAMRLGATLGGFIVESGFTGQGHTTVNRNILLPRDGRFVEAATFLAGMDDTLLRKGCDDNPDICGSNQAYDIDFALQIDQADPAAAAYPLRVQEQGTACGTTVSARYTLTLDPASFKYGVPAALHRELPCAPAET